MQILKVGKQFSNKDINVLADFLNKDKIIAIPTDTIYGFSCKLSSKSAISTVFKLKNRDKKQQFILLVSSLNMLKKYCIVNSRQEKYLKKVWPGKITVILKNKNQSNASNNTLAARLPKNDYLLKLIRKVKEPIVSTSANISGHTPCLSGEGIYKAWQNKKNQPDLVVFKKELKNNKASKIINILDIDDIKIIRK